MMRLLGLLVLAAASLAGAAATARSIGGPYAIEREVVAPGGGAASGRTRLFGIAAQSASGPTQSGRYALSAGFVAGTDTAAPPSAVFKDGFE